MPDISTSEARRDSGRSPRVVYFFRKFQWNAMEWYLLPRIRILNCKCSDSKTIRSVGD